jgi:hypothetical protein
MSTSLKSAFITLGLFAGVAAAAHAQSVSALPPTGTPSGQTAKTPPFTSNQSVFPKPGGNAVWQEKHYQPPAGYNADATQHPYSTSIGPKPGSHTSGPDVHYESTGEDAATARHPYTVPGMGPKPGGG